MGNVPETPEDMLSRVALMAEGDPKWDLSDNDRAAMKWLLQDRELAIKHDRQAYPTAEAYENVCAALERCRAQKQITSKDAIKFALLHWEDRKALEEIRAGVVESAAIDQLANWVLRHVDVALAEPSPLGGNLPAILEVRDAAQAYHAVISELHFGRMPAQVQEAHDRLANALAAVKAEAPV